MTTSQFFSFDELPSTSQVAIIEFNDRYLASMGAGPAPSWVNLGDLFPTDSPLTRFPVSQFGLKYRKARGENRTRTFAEKHFDIKSEEFKEGYQAPLIDILTKVFAYRNWQKAPQKLLNAEALLGCHMIAALLEDGENQKWGGSDQIDGKNFFATDHLSDVTDESSAPWGNYQGSTKDVVSIPNIEAEVTAMQEGVLDENGEIMGANPRVILCHPHKYEPLKNLLAKELILDPGGAAATNNPYWSGQEASGDPNAAPNGRFKVVSVPQFTSTVDWYLVDPELIQRMTLPPWILMRYMVPQNSGLALRVYGEDSDFFKDSGEIKVASHVWKGSSLGFPHGIRKVQGQ